jgi:hypothetical protein
MKKEPEVEKMFCLCDRKFSVCFAQWQQHSTPATASRWIEDFCIPLQKKASFQK